MSDIEKKQDSITTVFMGVAGIHGTGRNDTSNTINIYVTDPDAQEFKKILPDIKKEAKPHNIKVIEGEPPRFA